MNSVPKKARAGSFRLTSHQISVPLLDFLSLRVCHTPMSYGRSFPIDWPIQLGHSPLEEEEETKKELTKQQTQKREVDGRYDVSKWWWKKCTNPYSFLSHIPLSLRGRLKIKKGFLELKKFFFSFWSLDEATQSEAKVIDPEVDKMSRDNSARRHVQL